MATCRTRATPSRPSSAPLGADAGDRRPGGADRAGAAGRGSPRRGGWVTRRIMSILVLALVFAGTDEQASAIADYTVVACHGNAAAYSASFGNGVFGRATVGPGTARDWCDATRASRPRWGEGPPGPATAATWTPAHHPARGSSPTRCASSVTTAAAATAARSTRARAAAHAGRRGSLPRVRAAPRTGSGARRDRHPRAAAVHGLRRRSAATATGPSRDGGTCRSTVRVRRRRPTHRGRDRAGRRRLGARVAAVSFATEDSVGVKRVRIQTDPGGDNARSVLDAYQSCDYARLVPCREGRFTPSATVDTTGTGNGAHTLRYSAQDSANQWTHSDRELHVDNAPPSAAMDRAAGSVSRSVVWVVRDPALGRGHRVAARGVLGRRRRHLAGDDRPRMGPGRGQAVGRGSRSCSRRRRARPPGRSRPGAAGRQLLHQRGVGDRGRDTPGSPAIGVPDGWLAADSYDVALTRRVAGHRGLLGN